MLLPTSTKSLATTVDVLAPADLLLVELDSNWQILDSRFLSQEPNDVETHATGFKIHNGQLLIAYKQVKTVPGGLQFQVPLKIFEEDHSLVLTELVKVVASGPGTHRGATEAKSSLEVTDARIYVGLQSGAAAEIYVYEPN